MGQSSPAFGWAGLTHNAPQVQHPNPPSVVVVGLDKGGCAGWAQVGSMFQKNPPRGTPVFSEDIFPLQSSVGPATMGMRVEGESLL